MYPPGSEGSSVRPPSNPSSELDQSNILRGFKCRNIQNKVQNSVADLDGVKCSPGFRITLVESRVVLLLLSTTC